MLDSVASFIIVLREDRFQIVKRIVWSVCSLIQDRHPAANSPRHIEVPKRSPVPMNASTSSSSAKLNKSEKSISGRHGSSLCCRLGHDAIVPVTAGCSASMIVRCASNSKQMTLLPSAGPLAERIAAIRRAQSRHVTAAD